MLAEVMPPGMYQYLTDSELRPCGSGSASTGSGRSRRSNDYSQQGSGAETLHPSGRAAWYAPTLKAVANLLQFADNWDRYGARRIDPAIAEAAMSLLTSVMRDDTPSPTVVPTTRGGLQLEWHTRGIDLEVEFLSSVRVAGIYEDDRNDLSWEGDLSFNLQPLTDAILGLAKP